MCKYSFVIPCYKSSLTIKKVVAMTSEEMDKLNKNNYEFILVDDCSPDNGETVKVLRELAEQFQYIKVIELAKNVGQHNAIMAGLNNCNGDVVIGMDDDGQTHPSQLSILFDKFEEGHDIVYGYYPDKKHNFIRNIFSRLNHLSVRLLIKKPKDLKNSSFWVAKKFVIDEVIKYKGCYSYLQGLFIRTTKNIACVPIKHFNREVGKSGYTFKSLLKLWSSIIGFSVIPLRLSTYMGYISSIFGILSGIIVFIKKLLNPSMALGWPSVMVTIFIFSGLAFLFLGLIGEYIGRMYLAQNNQPQFTVRNKINCDNNSDEKNISNSGM